MEPGFWQQRWDEGKLGFHRSDVHPALQAFARETASLPAPVLVPLAGKTLDMRWLAEQGCPVTGVELVAKAVDDFFEEQRLTAHREPGGRFQRHRAQELDLTLLQGSVFDLGPGDVEGIQWVYDRAALVALPEDTRARYAELLTELLPKASLLVVTFVYDQGEMSGPPFSVSSEEVAKVFSGHHFEVVRDEEVLAEDSPLRTRLSSLREVVSIGRPLSRARGASLTPSGAAGP